MLLSAILIGSSCAVTSPATSTLPRQPQSVESVRTTEIDKLRAVIGDKQLRRHDPKRVIAAINRLGELKADSAIADLISILTFRQEFSEEQQEIDIIGLGQIYPAVGALWQIGKPALPAVTAVIATTDTKSIESRNATYTVMLIFRDYPKEGVSYLEDQASKAQKPAAASRLRAAAERIRGIINR
jgi:hypothetical protein